MCGAQVTSSTVHVHVNILVEYLRMGVLLIRDSVHQIIAEHVCSSCVRRHICVKLYACKRLAGRAGCLASDRELRGEASLRSCISHAVLGV